MTAKFGATSTADDVLAGLDLKGKRVLVTGTSSGLGLETARALVAHGADVVGTARDLDKAHAATAAVRAAAATSGSFELIELDLGSLGSVGACTDRLLFQAEPFDVVIANAGVMATHYGHTADGFETQMGTNHLGHFVLVNRLAPLLPGGSRVVVLSSNAHRMSDVDLEDLNYERRTYDGPAAYGQSKTANALFAVEFDRRHKDRGIRAVAVHPGVINTGLTRNVDVEMLKGWMAGLNASRAQQRLPPFEPKTIPQGAATSVWAAFTASSDEVGGRYCEDCHVAAEFKAPQDDGFSGGYRAYALDAARAAELWRKSEDLVGERY
ncbi:NAD(P)-dependent dehydrogenase (short-subunit alcohol dehydrogenase family) [Variovorax paradoxus]|uniref:Probable oxidoreductase n=1 Tax=Variovorax paradoxus TaxID=34073 RepID=A0AAE3Y585_VARPD|nr:MULTISPECIES: SDR family NAD(P)-dependent oxidoreductase [Variovorax]MBD9665281.1 SDR family NAD(P)-dependent oxidoreductase [Variovorax sp. VRV01]MDP9967042.1 NAD(P)-dependent dehydrogenase (short-subunit alcohol dehydrogenase family) [Variovorax paradoxus]MDR6429548.1 NAD(P)-dependent dehydrogenase (short-subunit alcohol dehydrogenase family) [Variovorax paradoxus]